jgi:hypothetical protein
LTVDTARIFEGRIEVDYGQAYVISGDADDHGDMSANFVGQSNGLLGAAFPGRLFLVTSSSSGDVGLTVEIANAEPALDDDWEDCVAASFSPIGLPVRVTQWSGEIVCEIPLAITDYRVRYCASHMDEAGDLHAFEKDGIVDSYLLTFWPAPPAPDQVIRQGSETAASCHATRRNS